MVVPIMDRGVLVDVREQVGRTGPQTAPTSDAEAVAVDTEIYWQIVDPLRSQLQVLDFRGAVLGVTSQIARSLVAEMTAEDAVRKQAWLGEKIREQLGEKVAEWGGVVTMVRVLSASKQ
jgi:regulator of protease activity HflC (stomatin/prohibitin superfamily)